MIKLRQVLLAVAIGMVLATIVVDVAAPGVIVWFNVPSSGDAMCLCGVQAKDTARHMVQSHLIGMAIGGLIGLVLSLLAGRSSGAAPADPTRKP